MRIENIKLLNALDASQAQTSAAQQIEHGYTYAITASATGSAIGVLKVQVSNDPGDSRRNDLVSAASFVDLPNQYLVINAGSDILNIPDAGYRWLRLVWTPVAGTGTITAQFNSKGA